MTKLDQEEDPSDFPDEDSSLVESMGSYEDAYEEHEQSCGVDDSSPYLHPCVAEEYDEHLIVPMREGDQGGDERLMFKHREHIEE